MPITEAVRHFGISRASITIWRKKYAGLEVSDAKRLKALEDENRRLKRVVADRRSTSRCSRTSFPESGEARRAQARSRARTERLRRERAAGDRVLRIHRSTARYRAQPDRSRELRERLRHLAVECPRAGYRLMLDRIRWEGTRVNHKRMHRVYREEGLQLPKRRRKHLRSVRRQPLTPAAAVNSR
jgi:hypothetical protein